jgi:hypothetical protein
MAISAPPSKLSEVLGANETLLTPEVRDLHLFKVQDPFMSLPLVPQFASLLF